MNTRYSVYTEDVDTFDEIVAILSRLGPNSEITYSQHEKWCQAVTINIPEDMQEELRVLGADVSIDEQFDID